MTTPPQFGLLDWRLDAHGVQLYDAPDHAGQWLAQSCKCPHCGHRWAAVAPVGLAGIECPACHACEWLYVWGQDADG